MAQLTQADSERIRELMQTDLTTLSAEEIEHLLHEGFALSAKVEDRLIEVLGVLQGQEGEKPGN